MKDTVWKLFEETGNTGYYLLYKQLSDGKPRKKGKTDKRNKD